MGTPTRLMVLALLALCGLVTTAHAQEQDVAQARAQHWASLREAIFGTRALQDGTGTIQLDAPARALDAALVPITVTLSGHEPVKGVYVVIDMNPAPLAGHFTFGPESDPRVLKLRVRVEQYTLIHAIAETAGGKLYLTERFVKASGGCSAPAGANDAEALRDLGEMKLKMVGPFSPGNPALAQLMIRHPNFNGMQMNQLTQLYTPARYLKSVDVSYGGGRVFHLDSDISLSSDPVITFGFVPKDKGAMQVVARDSKDSVFQQQFKVP